MKYSDMWMNKDFICIGYGNFLELSVFSDRKNHMIKIKYGSTDRFKNEKYWEEYF